MAKQVMDTLAQVYQELTGEKQMTITHYRDLVRALSEGQKNILLHLPWYERIGDKLYQSNQIVLHQLKNQRVYFSNPLKRGDEEPGMKIEGMAMGPQRQVHGGGLQSMDLLLFKQLFIMGGGQALITPLK